MNRMSKRHARQQEAEKRKTVYMYMEIIGGSVEDVTPPPDPEVCEPSLEGSIREVASLVVSKVSGKAKGNV